MAPQEGLGSLDSVRQCHEVRRADKVPILSSNYFERNQERLRGAVFIGDGQGLMLISGGPGSL